MIQISPVVSGRGKIELMFFHGQAPTLRKGVEVSKDITLLSFSVQLKVGAPAKLPPDPSVSHMWVMQGGECPCIYARRNLKFMGRDLPCPPV